MLWEWVAERRGSSAARHDCDVWLARTSLVWPVSCWVACRPLIHRVVLRAGPWLAIFLSIFPSLVLIWTYRTKWDISVGLSVSQADCNHWCRVCVCTEQVNAHESIIIDSWVSRVQYNALCHVLGTGMSIHLQVLTCVVVISVAYWSCMKLLLHRHSSVVHITTYIQLMMCYIYISCCSLLVSYDCHLIANCWQRISIPWLVGCMAQW